MKSTFKVPAILAIVLVAAFVIGMRPLVPFVSALENNLEDAAIEAAVNAVAQDPTACTNPDDTLVLMEEIEVEETEPPTQETEPPVIETEPAVVETEPATEPATEPELEPEIKTEPEHKHEQGCNHFWRQEYQPETETEDGRIYESCLYCGEYRLISVIPAYGAN